MTTANRRTRETDISLALELQGSGRSRIATGIGFFDHMLTALAANGGLDMELSVQGDLHVDGHHTVEDVGIVLGKALGEEAAKLGPLARYGWAMIPMDEALALCSLDVCNRPFLVFEAGFANPAVGQFDTCLVEEFFRALAMNAGITLHLSLLHGQNDHHRIEALFKAFAHALKQAKQPAEGTLSTKGVL